MEQIEVAEVAAEMTATAGIATIGERTDVRMEVLVPAVEQQPLIIVGKQKEPEPAATSEVVAAGNAEIAETEHSISRALGSRTSTRQDLTEDNIRMHAGTTAVTLTSRWVTLTTARTGWPLALEEQAAGSLVKMALLSHKMGSAAEPRRASVERPQWAV